MSRRQTLLVSAFFVFAGCNQSQPAPPASGPVASCAKGWLSDALYPDGSCATACQAKTPECPASDCVQRSFHGYLAGGVEVEVAVSYSASMGTMSTVTMGSKRSYEITSDTTYVLTPPGGEQGTITASCKNGQLVDTKSGSSLTSGVWAPASNGFAQGLDAQFNAGKLSWSGVPVQK